MDDHQNRYGNNANNWRRTYGYVRRKPAMATFYDENLSVTRSFDLNSTYRHRDYFEVQGYNFDGPEPDWIPRGFEFEEGYVFFNNEDYKEHNFGSTFRSTPYVIYEPVENAEGTHNINVFGTRIPSNEKMFIGTSALFTGYVHYIAMAAPTWAQDFVSGSTTHVWAGEVDLNNVHEYTASYNLPPAGSDYVYYDTIHEGFNSFTANTYTENITKDETTATNILSADTINKLHFIIFRVS